MKKISLHETISSEIRHRILLGEWVPGHKVPSEVELMAHYGCSRMTVNKALSALSATGLVVRRKRAGTLVAKRNGETLLLDVPDLKADVEARGRIYHWQLISANIIKPDRALHARLKIRDSGPMLHIIGVHGADGESFAYEERYVNLSAVPDMDPARGLLDLTSNAPGSWLLQHIPWTEAEHRISADGASHKSAEAMDIPEGSPCLVVERRTWRTQQWVTHVWQWFAAGRHEMIARFGPGGVTRI